MPDVYPCPECGNEETEWGKTGPTDESVPPPEGVRARLEGSRRTGHRRRHHPYQGRWADSAAAPLQERGVVQGPIRDGKALLGRQCMDGAHGGLGSTYSSTIPGGGRRRLADVQLPGVRRLPSSEGSPRHCHAPHGSGTLWCMAEKDSRRSQLLRGVLDICLLAVMSEGPAYGYEMTKRLRARGL